MLLSPDLPDFLTEAAWAPGGVLYESVYLHCIGSAGGRFERLNPAWGRILGYTLAELQEVPFREFVHPDDLAATLEKAAESLVKPVVAFEHRFRCKDGTYRWLQWHWIPAASGAYSYGIARDITEHRRLQDSQTYLAFLSAFTSDMASTLDYEAALERAARACIPMLADWCTAYLVDPGFKLRAAAAAHTDPELEQLALEIQRRFPPDGTRPGFRAALETGRSLVVHEASDALLRDRSYSEEHFQLIKRLDPKSYLLAPLVARGRVLGLLALVSSTPGRLYGADDQALAEDVDRRAALAIDNARLYREVQESHALLDVVMAGSPSGMAFLDRELRYVLVNKTLADWNGLSIADHVGRTVYEVLPDRFQEIVPSLLQVLSSGMAVRDQEEIRVRGGETLHWVRSVYPVRSRNGDVIGVGVQLTDFSASKRLESAVLQLAAVRSGQKRILEMILSEEPLADILAALVRFLEERCPGFVASVLVQEQHGSELRYVIAPRLPPECRSSATIEESHVAARQAGYVLVASETISTREAGEIGAVSVYAPAGMTGAPLDPSLVDTAADLAGIAVTNRHHDEGRDRKLQSLIENLEEGVIAFGGDGRVLFVNPAAQRLLHLETPADGRPLADSGLPEPLVEALDQASRTSETRRTNFSFGQAHLSAYISPVVTEAGRYGAISLLRDVTADIKLRRLHESFITNVSHELRTPLTALSAVVEALADGVVPEGDRPRYMLAVRTEVERLRRLANDLIDLTRLDAGVEEFAPAPFEVGRLVESVADKWYHRCQKAGIALEVDTEPVEVLADFDRFEQILTNLLENAVRFTPAGGRIRLLVRRTGTRAQITVADTGIGIAEAHLPYLWERFYKADPARTKTREGGTGLGLALVKQMAERMGGTVSVQSQPGKGSEFMVSLPIARSAEGQGGVRW